MRNTYRTIDEASQDKALLAELHVALNAWPSALRRDEAGLWILRGRPGCYASTSGDGKSWQLVVTPDEMISKQQWTWFKRRLAFCELTQEGDQEGGRPGERAGVLVPDLPEAAEAEEIRDIIGIRKRVAYSPEELARRQEQGRHLHVSGG